MPRTLLDDCLTPGWPAPENVRALVTTRAGGVSQGNFASLNLGDRVGDDPAMVAENRARLARLLPAEPFWLRQVHGARVVVAGPNRPMPEADAAISDAPGVVLAIQSADCLPVLLADRAGTVIGAAHAGWRGLAAGVLENTVRALAIAPEALLAWLGPAIGPRRFEVGGEVRAVFVAADPGAREAFVPGAPGKWYADIYQLARRRLRSAGVSEVYGGGFCTVEETGRWFSHRRDQPSGRLASLVWLA